MLKNQPRKTLSADLESKPILPIKQLSTEEPGLSKISRKKNFKGPQFSEGQDFKLRLRKMLRKRLQLIGELDLKHKLLLKKQQENKQKEEHKFKLKLNQGELKKQQLRKKLHLKLNSNNKDSKKNKQSEGRKFKHKLLLKELKKKKL